MTSDYRVDLDGLQQLIDDTAALESALEDHAGAIDDRVAGLHVQWTGDSADAHHTAHTQRMAAITEMRQALAALRSTLAAARDAYQQVGQVNRRMWP